MKFHVVFLLVCVSLAAAQTLESLKNDESKASWNLLRALQPLLDDSGYLNPLVSQNVVPYFKYPSQLGLHIIHDSRPSEEQIKSRARSNSQDEEAGRYFAPLYRVVVTTVIAPHTSTTTATVTSTCIPTSQLSNGASATPCSLYFAGKRKKRNAVSEEETIEPSKIEPLGPTVVKTLDKIPNENTEIASSQGEDEPLYRNPRFIFGFNIYSQPTVYTTQTSFMTVTQNFVQPAGAGYLFCLPSGYIVCPN